MIQSQSKKN